MKSLKTGRLIFFTSFLIAVVVSLIIFLTYNFYNRFPLLSLIGIGILIFIVCNIVFRFVLKKFFFVNLKTIYKNISSATGSQKHEMGKEIKEDEIIPEIAHLLSDWEKNQEKEIDKLKELELYRREFLGNVSHELKTPIFNVQGYIHTLIDGGIEDTDINMLYLQKAAKSLDRLISIVDDLESISKLEAGKLIIEPRTFDISELAKEVIESLELQAKERNISFKIKDGSDKPFYVYADKERIRQVLVNLLVNSLKYGKSGGETEVNITERSEIIIVDINDNGIGIEKYHLPRLFERFYRVDKSRSREQGGTGLGLAIVKHIIEAHGQKISATSEYGYGTIFSFTLAKSK